MRLINIILERIKKAIDSRHNLFILFLLTTTVSSAVYVPPNGLLCLKMYQERWSTS